MSRLNPVGLLLATLAVLGCGDGRSPSGGADEAWLVAANVTPVVVAADGSEAAMLSVVVTDGEGQPAPTSTRMLVIGRLEASGEPTGVFGLTGESQMFLNVASDGRVSAEFRCTEAGQVRLLARLFSDELGETLLECAAP